MSPVGRKDSQVDVELARIILIPGAAGFVMGFGSLGLVAGLIFAALFSTIGVIIYYTVVVGSAKAAAGLLLPDDRGGHAPGYSHIEAIEAKGDFNGALDAWEQVIHETPEALAPRVHAADLYARKANNPTRAAELFRSVQTHAMVPDDTRRYVSQRLIDLLLGPLNDQGRALVELRKVADRWPNTREGDGAKQAIARIKAAREASQGQSGWPGA